MEKSHYLTLHPSNIFFRHTDFKLKFNIQIIVRSGDMPGVAFYILLTYIKIITYFEHKIGLSNYVALGEKILIFWATYFMKKLYGAMCTKSSSFYLDKLFTKKKKIIIQSKHKREQRNIYTT